MIRKLGLDDLIASAPSRRRNLVVAMIVERLIFPSSKPANTRHWHDTTLAEELNVTDATEDQLYEAMDWLLQRRAALEKKLARRHLGDGAPVLYDVTGSYSLAVPESPTITLVELRSRAESEPQPTAGR
jgi:hypothetical protein